MEPAISTKHPSPSTQLFPQAEISIAIDVSGSTYGNILKAEIRAIYQICDLFPPSLKSRIGILPWSDFAAKPIGLSQLETLQSDGDTDPNVLLEDPACLHRLQSSSFWFLFTDGGASDQKINTFVERLVGSGLHGLASVVALFGDGEQPPLECNLSIGQSVLGVSPHCAFLYTNVITGFTYILQTKGCFSALLAEEKTNPILDANTRWGGLQRTSYENFTRVPIPPTQPLGKDEVILPESAIANPPKTSIEPGLDIEVPRQLFDTKDGRQNISLSAMTLGQCRQVREPLALDKVENAGVEPRMKLEQSQGANIGMTNNVSSKSTARESSTELRGPTRQPRPYVPTGCPTNLAPRGAEEGPCGSLRSASQGASSKGCVDAPVNPGFHESESSKDYFAASCKRCGKRNSVMVLFLQVPPDKPVTPFLPLPNSHAPLAYPLTMGNYPETDIILTDLITGIWSRNDPKSSGGNRVVV
ncbi:hypothetical protein ABW19_dt0209618 [Dactylella cylindrospora]|nr:hypothetical protein ABW19_dt0209618 [Dactylella cylindrospora]